jgi:hypothetical protein
MIPGEETAEETETAEVTESVETIAEETTEAAAEEPVEDIAEPAVEENTQDIDLPAVEPMDEIAPQPKKKRPFIQIPVIVSLCILLLAVIGYFVFNLFFLREPEGVVWMTKYDDVPYYFEFREDNVFKSYVGSVELTGTYEKVKDGDNNYLIVNADAGDFVSGQQATYEITGSRVLCDQVLSCSYGEGSSFSFTQVKQRENPLELPQDFKADEALLGEWVFTFYGYEYCSVNFNDDGSMQIGYPQNGVTYNGTYSIEDGKVNFTYYVNDYLVEQIEYTVDGDNLTFMQMNFVRRGTEAATADEATVAASKN